MSSASMQLDVGSVLLLALVACHSQRPHPCIGEPAVPTPGRAARVLSPVNAGAARGIPPAPAADALESAPCVVRGRATRHGVAWKLRTRLDAIATLQVDDGFATAWIAPGRRRGEPQAFVRLENEAMALYARVASEDLKVVVTQAFMSLPGHFPDGETHRAIVEIEGAEALLDIGIDGAIGTASSLTCASLGFEPNDAGSERLLPPKRGEVVVKRSASVRTEGDFVPVRGFQFPFGVSEPDGVLADLRGDDSDPAARRVSFRLCGGTVLGWVAKADLLGPPRILHGSSAHCPNTGQHVFVIAPKLQGLVTCPNELPVLIRSATLEDPVGVIKAGAKFRVDGHEVGATTLVTLETPPAVPIGDASFAVPSEALGECLGPARH
jgi:hypothetical protein